MKGRKLSIYGQSYWLAWDKATSLSLLVFSVVRSLVISPLEFSPYSYEIDVLILIMDLLIFFFLFFFFVWCGLEKASFSHRGWSVSWSISWLVKSMWSKDRPLGQFPLLRMPYGFARSWPEMGPKPRLAVCQKSFMVKALGHVFILWDLPSFNKRKNQKKENNLYW